MSIQMNILQITHGPGPRSFQSYRPQKCEKIYMNVLYLDQKEFQQNEPQHIINHCHPLHCVAFDIASGV